MSIKTFFEIGIFVLCIFTTPLCANEEENNSEEAHNIEVGENRLAAQLFGILDHYKQEDPVGIPGAPIPDPMPVADMKKTFAAGTLLSMREVQAYGLSKFRIKYVKTDIKDLKVDAKIQLDVMIINGSYSFSALFSRADGPFTIVLKNVIVIGNASLGVERDGKLRTQRIDMDISFSDMSMDFNNLGFFGAIFQGIVNSAPTIVFDAMKPFMLAESHKKLQTEIDTNIQAALGDYSFPNSISPLDMAISEARKKVRSLGYDPYILPNYNRTIGLFTIEMTNTWIVGLSSFYRVGSVVVKMEDNVASTLLHLGTQKIDGGTQWEVSFGNGMITRSGHAQFTVQHIKAAIELSQPLDTRKRSKIEDLQIDLGNIQVRCDGAGTLDYIFEFVVNVLPNLLRYQIMDAIENPLKMRIQERLNQIDVEKAIKENWNSFDKMGMNISLDFKF